MLPKPRMRLLYLTLDRLVEKGGDLLNCLILHCLLAIRAFYRQAMDFGSECLELSLVHTSLRWL